MVHKQAHEAALKFCDTWQMFSKLLDDTTNAETDVRYEKRYPHDRGQHVNSTGCFSSLYYLVRLSACVLVHVVITFCCFPTRQSRLMMIDLILYIL